MAAITRLSLSFVDIVRQRYLGCPLKRYGYFVICGDCMAAITRLSFEQVYVHLQLWILYRGDAQAGL